MSRLRAWALTLALFVVSGSISHAPVMAQGDASSPGACATIEDAMVAKVTDLLHGAGFDAAVAGAMMEPNIVYTSPIWGVVTGKDAVVGAFADLATSFTGLTLTPEDVLVDDPYIVVRYTLTGTHDGEFGGVAATGSDISTTGISVYRMHCGMIGEAWTQFDHLGLKAQVDGRYAAMMPSEPMSAPDQDASCVAPSRDDMQTLVREMYTEAWTKEPNLAAVLAPDVVLHSALGPDIQGIEAVEPLRQNYFTAFPDIAYRHGEIIADGDLAAAMWTATGTDAGGFVGEEPTGGMMVLDGISIYRGECGKIAEIWTESDLAGALEQLGTDGLK